MPFLEFLFSAKNQREAKEIAGDQLALLSASAGRGDRRAVSQAEGVVSRDPKGAFSQAANGSWLLECASSTWNAGVFSTPTVAELEARCEGRKDGRNSRLTFSILDGASPLTDIGGLQATSPGRCLFQVASQFNCLESPGPFLVHVAEYFNDPTQGPRAAIGAFPAALLRHYHAPGPDGDRIRQDREGKQIDLLATACGSEVTRNGYLLGQGIPEPNQFVERLEAHWREVRIGLHEDVEVVLGFDWDGEVNPPQPPIAQVLTSTVAGGFYGAEANLGTSVFERAARALLQVAYLGTLLAAIQAEKRWVVLTLIGGGAFGNPIHLIWESILWALDRVEPFSRTDLHVVLNGRDLSTRLNLDTDLLPEVVKRSGRIFRFDSEGLVEIRD